MKKRIRIEITSDHKYGKQIVFGVLSVMIIVFLYLAIKKTLENQELLEDPVLTVGIVTGIYEGKSSESAHYKFRLDDGRYFSGRAFDKVYNYKENDEILIYYLRRNPMNNRSYDDMRNQYGIGKNIPDSLRKYLKQ